MANQEHFAVLWNAAACVNHGAISGGVYQCASFGGDVDAFVGGAVALNECAFDGHLNAEG